jgi:hypothetical protein
MSFPVGAFSPLFARRILCVIFLTMLSRALSLHAQSKAAAPAANPAPDELVLSNGDTLHGKLISETAGKITFHSDPLGDVSIGWDKIKEIHTAGKFGILEKNAKLTGKKAAKQIPTGPLEMSNQTVTVRPENAAPVAPIPVANAPYILDEATLNKYIYHRQGFFEGWNGPITAGATLVSATDNQYTFSGAGALARVEPTVTWLDTRNRTLLGINESYGKITQPAYTIPAVPATPTTPAAPATFVPSVVTKSSIFHLGAERDEYFSPRVYALGQVAFDHNYAQDLQLQQIYGGGIGWTVVKSPKQEFDLKGTVQYERQQFIPNSGNTNEDLIGSTFAAAYLLKLKLLTYTQTLAYIPAYNNPKAYSVTETNTVAFPAYKNLSFSLGTLDTYLNNAPFIGTTSNPPTKPNSFQFTMGLTYAIKSKY